MATGYRLAQITVQWDCSVLSSWKFLGAALNPISLGKTEIGRAVRDRRKALRLTQRELGDYADLSVNSLYQIERGQANPTLETLLKLTEALGLRLELRARLPAA